MIRTIKKKINWPEYRWWPLVADTIKTALSSLTLEELNDRMESLNYPVEPFLEELEGEDTMEFSPPPEAPVEEDAVIPPHVLDALLEAPEEEARASLEEALQNEGRPTPDREAIAAARWMAVEVANEYLAKRREARDPRRPCAPPPQTEKSYNTLKGSGSSGLWRRRSWRSWKWCWGRTVRTNQAEGGAQNGCRQRCDDRFVRGRGRQPSKSQSAQKEAIGDALAFASTRSTKRPSQTTEGTTAVAAVAVPVASAYCGARVFNWWHRDQRG
ncbi:unnamed protein product [Ascophyllum nodosum]